MKSREQGYVLLAILAILFLAGAAWFVNSTRDPIQDFAQRRIDEQRRQQLEKLEEARMRLIEWSINNTTNPGVMPCPAAWDSSVNQWIPPSSCPPETAKTAGRFTFSQLSALTPGNEKTPVKDSADECVWYAISPALYSGILPVSRVASSGTGVSPHKQPINPDAYNTATRPPALFVNNQPVLALLIAPGPALLTQTRTSSASSPSPLCKQDLPSNFLDALEGINNFAPQSADSDSHYKYARTVTALNLETGKCVLRSSITDSSKIGAECSNDVILPITRADLMKPLLRVVLEKLAERTSSNTSTPESCPSSSGGSDKSIETSLPLSSTGRLDALRASTTPLCFDHKVFPDMGSEPAKSGTTCYKSSTTPNPLWLCVNDWYHFITYDTTSLPASLAIKLDASDSNSYRCTILLNDDNPRKAICQ